MRMERKYSGVNFHLFQDNNLPCLRTFYQDVRPTQKQKDDALTAWILGSSYSRQIISSAY